MDDSHPMPTALDPRVVTARRVVRVIAAIVGLILVGASVLGVYAVATDRPARELFFPPEEPEP